MHKQFAALLTLSVSLFSGQAGAAVINFEGVVQPDAVWYDPAPYTQSGFQLQSHPAQQKDSSAIYGASVLHTNSNGSTIYGFCSFNLNCKQDVFVTLSALGGAAFSLSGLDAANLDLSGRSGAIDLVGHLASGATVHTSINAADWQNYRISGFERVTSVDFYGRGITVVAIDNLNVGAAIPEPGTAALLLLSVAGLAGARRRQA